MTLVAQDGHVIQIDKSEKLRLNCNSGGRRYNAYRKLQKLAYPDITQAIFADWQDVILPVIK